MLFTPSGLDGVLVSTPKIYRDERGAFSETFRQSWLEDAGVFVRLVQFNRVLSHQSGTMRGLHFQIGAAAQGKLIQVVRGSIFDVAVDIRPDSASFGRHVAFELAENVPAHIWIPPGFAHGYVTTAPDTLVTYATSAYYEPAAERGVAFDDPALGIAWPMPAAEMKMSDKDRQWPGLAAAVPASGGAG